VSDPIDGGLHVGSTTLGPQTYLAATKKVTRQDLTVQLNAVGFKKHPGARFHFLAGMHQALPQL